LCFNVGWILVGCFLWFGVVFSLVCLYWLFLLVGCFVLGFLLVGCFVFVGGFFGVFLVCGF
jgi:hypothetical protein